MKKSITLYLALFIPTMGLAVETNDPELNAMGGVTTTNGNENAASMYYEDSLFELTLPSTTLYVQDPKGFTTEFYEFADEDIQAYADFDFEGVSTSLTDLTNSINVLANEANDFKANPNSSNLQDLQTAKTDFSNNLVDSQSRIGTMTDLTVNTQDGFDDVSNKPLNMGLLINMGLTIPQSKVPFSIQADNKTIAGLEMELEESDLDTFVNVLTDSDEYLNNVTEVDNSLTVLIEKAEELEANPNPTTQNEFEAALTDFENEQNELSNTTTSNNVYVNGEFQDGSVEVTIDDLDSKINTLGLNIAELSVGSYYPLMIKNTEISLGATLNVRYLTIFDDSYQVKDFENMTASQYQNRLQNNTENYLTANMDIGAAYSRDFGFGEMVFATVIKDVVPQSFESALGNEINFSPKVKLGAMHSTKWSSLRVDFDITENEALGYGVDTRYVNLGGELKAGKHIALRAGYRHNFSVENDSLYSVGLGLTPFGVGVDLAAFAKPYDKDDNKGINAGASAKFSMKF